MPISINTENSGGELVLPLCEAERAVNKLQKRLFKAKLENRKRDVKFLSSLISKSYYAFILAFDRVVRKNTGKKTAGVDKIKLKYVKKDFIKTYKEFYLPFILQGCKSYKPKPLRRIDIPKPDGTMRHLGIPTHWDRIYQAMLTYIVEALVEVDIYSHKLNSFGFRRNIKTADAINSLGILARKGKNAIVIEADIQKCFDEISHKFMVDTLAEENLPNPVVDHIQKMLKLGFIDITGFHDTDSGTPQGGIISPALANLVLRKPLDIPFNELPLKGIATKNLVTYADDLIISLSPNSNGISQTTLVQTIKGLMAEVRTNLAKVGLVIKESKTSIRWNGWNISEKGINWDIGIKESKDITFDFLGFQLGIGTGIRPSKKRIKTFLEKVHELIKLGSAVKTNINPVIRGFYNYYANFSSELMCKDLNKCDWIINRQIRKGAGTTGKYTKKDLNSLVTYADIPKSTKYISVRKGASFLSETQEYWEKRKIKELPDRKRSIWIKQDKKCPICGRSISSQDIAENRTETHHVQPKGKGGKDTNKNVILIHNHCHKEVHKHL